MNIYRRSADTDVEDKIIELLGRLYEQGAISSEVLEEITYYKEFHPDQFALHEQQFLSCLGLFYKVSNPDNLLSHYLSAVGVGHYDRFGAALTPVQASVRQVIDDHQFVSISAPTSAGKSYSIRGYINDVDGDVVIIIPSRSLIAEYVGSLRAVFGENKSVMVLTFVDNVFKARVEKRIYVLTPERARELFQHSELNIKLFFFDEAQLSEEGGRGIIFDSIVRRAQKVFPRSKMIFAHPFVENPVAQLQKHRFDKETSFAHSYPFGSVGKLFAFKHKSNGSYYYFSPFSKDGYLLKNSKKVDFDFESFAFQGDKSVLVYVSKASIYDGRFIAPYWNYISQYSQLESEEALRIVDKVAEILGANENEHYSSFVDLLRRGVVIHHGSVPLDVRFLVEDLIRLRVVKICFATSTLAQGVNMPFDLVWLDNLKLQGEDERSRCLSLKNLIGRAGRLTPFERFDYGYVFTKYPKEFSKKLNHKYYLSGVSLIDSMDVDVAGDDAELLMSVREDTFDHDLQAPLSKVQRLEQSDIMRMCSIVLSAIYGDDSIRDALEGANNKPKRDRLIAALLRIYEAAIGRSLFDGELSVFKEAVKIFMWIIQGRSFKEVVAIRFGDARRKRDANVIDAGFIQKAVKLPNATLSKPLPLFGNVPAKSVSYDRVVYDTYDFLDTVISFSLVDNFILAFKIYWHTTLDQRANKFIELLRFGTNDSMHILLTRYGFTAEVITEITDHIKWVNEDTIVFKDSIFDVSEIARKAVEWYLP